MIDPDDLRLNIVRPALITCNLHSDNAENLIMGTAAVESDMGTFINQKNGPALSPWMIEPNTHKDIYLNFLSYNSQIREKILSACYYVGKPPDDALSHNLRYAALICRIKYLRDPEELPSANDIEGLANYWKRVYNTENGAGSIDDFITKYKKYLS